MKVESIDDLRKLFDLVNEFDFVSVKVGEIIVHKNPRWSQPVKQVEAPKQPEEVLPAGVPPRPFLVTDDPDLYMDDN